MRITIIGAGNIGGKLARAWARKGHEIRLGVRDAQDASAAALKAEHPDRISVHPLNEAAQGAEAVVFAVPSGAAYEAAKAVGNVGEAVVIDAMNALFTKPAPYDRTSAALAAATGSSRVVKCFNWTGGENIENPDYNGTPADMLLCGDDAAAKALTRKLAEDCGFRVFDLGGLKHEPLLESAALLWITLASEGGVGRQFAFRVMER